MSRIIGNVKDLSASVEEATKHKVKQKVQQAFARADEIEEDAIQKAERIQEEILAQAREQAQAKRQQILPDAHQTAKKRRLVAREEIIDQVWKDAESRLRHIVDSEEYPSVLRRLAWEAVQTFSPGDIVLAADPQGHNLLTEKRLQDWSERASEDFEASVQFQRADDPIDSWGGLIATKNQGRNRLDARFSQRLETARSEIRDKVFERLMGER